MPIAPNLAFATPQLPTKTLDHSRWFAMCMGIAILGYLLPWHSPLGRDFLVNSFSFGFICLGLAGFFWQNTVKQMSLSVMSWGLLALWLLMQSKLVTIAYPDALVFPIICLVIVALTAWAVSNIADKALLLNRLFPFVYVMALLTFAIQVMQIGSYQISWQGWVIARGAANGSRLDGNFGQPNHTAYGFVLALCGIMYQLEQAFNQAKQHYLPRWVTTLKHRQAYRFGLMVMFVLFTIGLALTQSRAGLIMTVAAIGIYFFAQPLAWRKKFLLTGFGWAMFLLYYVGTSWVVALVSNAASQLGAVSRLAGGEGNRTALKERAWLMFQEHPWTGVGWNNYMASSVEYAQRFKWPEIADHSHNFVSMIFAELGLIGALCFVPIVWLLLRAIHFKHSAESAIACAFVAASLLYASVEYPLWYFRYLAVFALFLALIEQRHLTIKLPKMLTQAWAMVLALLVGASVFYAQAYLDRNYLDYNRFVNHTNHLTTDEKISSTMPVTQPMFGFGAYDGRLLAMQVPVNDQQISQKLEIFNDVLTSDSSQFNLLAKAQLLAYQGDKAGALTQIQAACVMVRDVHNCDNVDIDLGKLAKENPQVFANLYQQFVEWRHQNPEKTGLVTPQ